MTLLKVSLILLKTVLSFLKLLVALVFMRIIFVRAGVELNQLTVNPTVLFHSLRFSMKQQDLSIKVAERERAHLQSI